MPKQPRETFWTRINRFPPILVRLLARHPRGEPMTTLEIADRSGLSPFQVEALSQSTDWSTIDLPTAQKFLCACRIDLTNTVQMKRVKVYLKGPVKNGVRAPTPYRYLKTSPLWPTYYQPLRDRWCASLIARSGATSNANRGL